MMRSQCRKGGVLRTGEQRSDFETTDRLQHGCARCPISQIAGFWSALITLFRRRLGRWFIGQAASVR